MKRIVFVCLLITLINCESVYNPATQAGETIYLGMPISEFKTKVGKKAKLEVMESGYTVYKMYNYDVMSGQPNDVRFFYFDSEGKLYKFDGGEFKQQRYQVETISR